MRAADRRSGPRYRSIFAHGLAARHRSPERVLPQGADPVSGPPACASTGQPKHGPIHNTRARVLARRDWRGGTPFDLQCGVRPAPPFDVEGPLEPGKAGLSPRPTLNGLPPPPPSPWKGEGA